MKTVYAGIFAVFLLGTPIIHSQEVIVSDGRVLLQQDDGSFKTIDPKPYLHDEQNIQLMMTLDSFKELSFDVEEVQRWRYQGPVQLLRFQATVQYRFDAIDVSIDGPGFQLTSLRYVFDSSLSRDEFYELTRVVREHLDGMPLQAVLSVERQEVPIEFPDDFDDDYHKLIDSEVYLFADSGTFKTKLSFRDGIVTLEHHPDF